MVSAGKVHFPYEARPLVEALKKAEQLPFQTEEAIDLDSLELDEDETLHLPPTPSQMAMDESVGFKEAWESQDRPDHDDDESERVFLRQMGPPPKHKSRQSRDLKSSAAGPSDSSEQHEQADVKSEIPAALPTEEEQTRIPTPPTVGSRAGTPDPSGPPPPLPRRRRPVPPPPASQQGSRAATPDFSRDSTDSARPPPTYPQQEKTEVPAEKQVTEDESLR